MFAFFHPGNPNLLTLYGLIVGFLLLLFVIDCAIDFFRNKPWRKIHLENKETSMSEDSTTDSKEQPFQRISIV